MIQYFKARIRNCSKMIISIIFEVEIWKFYLLRSNISLIIEENCLFSSIFYLFSLLLQKYFKKEINRYVYIIGSFYKLSKFFRERDRDGGKL